MTCCKTSWRLSWATAAEYSTAPSFEAYRATQEGNSWHTAPDDGYLYNHLAYHLDAVVACGPRATEELRNLSPISPG